MVVTSGPKSKGKPGGFIALGEDDLREGVDGGMPAQLRRAAGRGILEP